MLGEISRFGDYKRYVEGRSQRTVRAYTDALLRLREFLAERDYRRVSRDDLELFCGLWLHKRGVTARSRRPYIAAVREFYRWLLREGVVQADPSADLVYPQTGFRVPRVFTLSSAERLMWAPDFSSFLGVRDAAMLSLMMGCGLRVSDVVRMNDSHLLTTEYRGETRMVVRPVGKGNKERLVPVPKEAELVVRLYLEHEGLSEIDRELPDGDRVLFVSTGNRVVLEHEYCGERRRLSAKAVWRMIQAYGQKTGIPPEQLHPHALRHLFGTELAEDDVDLVMRSDLLGHVDPKTTAIYTTLAMRKKIDVVDKSAPLTKMRTPAGDLLARLRRE